LSWVPLLLPGPDSVFRGPVRLFLDPSCCVFLGLVAGRRATSGWQYTYLYQVEVPLVGELFQEGEDLPQPYTKCCVLFLEIVGGRRATTG
jgi:hypothetical protein